MFDYFQSVIRLIEALFLYLMMYKAIGIGTPIAERPPTPPDIRITYPAIRPVKTDTNEHLVCLALGNATLPAFQQLLHNISKNTLFDSHDHLPKPFGWAPFGPSPG